MNYKTIGIAMALSAVLLLIVIISFKLHIEKIVREEIKERQGVCIVEGECLHDKNALPLQTYGGIIIASALLAFGIYMLIFCKDKKMHEDAEKLSMGDYEKAMKSCSTEEKTLLQMLKESNGTMFQSDLVEKSGFTKVKVTRILDVLEGKRLVERKRRGMTNVVILK